MCDLVHGACTYGLVCLFSAVVILINAAWEVSSLEPMAAKTFQIFTCIHPFVKSAPMSHALGQVPTCAPCCIHMALNNKCETAEPQ